MAPGVACRRYLPSWSPSSTWLLGRFRPAKSPSPVVGDLMFSIGMETVFTFTRTYVGDRGIGSTGLFFGCLRRVRRRDEIVGGRRYDRVPQRPFVAGSPGYGSGLVLAIAANTAVIVMAASLRYGPRGPVPDSDQSGGEPGTNRRTWFGDVDLHLDLRHRPSRVRPRVGVVIDGFDCGVLCGC